LSANNRRLLRHLLILLVLYLPLAGIYGLVAPVFEGPDEIDHILYVKHIAEGRGIPVQSPEYAIAYGFGQEGSQAPLYYALNAALVRLFRLSLADVEGMPPSNPFSTCGQPEAEYNVARYRHDPRQEAFPYQGAARAIHVMRLFSALLGGVTVVAVYAAARLAFRDAEEAGLLAAVLVAFNPQFAFMGGVINNDNLVNCLTAVAVALTVYCFTRGFTWRRALVLGLVCGLAPLAKLGGLTALAFAGMGLLANCIRQIADRKSQITDRKPQIADFWPDCSLFIVHSSLLIGAFLAVAGWWFVRNWMLYGDPTGVNMMRAIYGGRDGWPAHLVIPEILTTFRSYWAAFACQLSFPTSIHWVFALLVGLGVAGFVKGWRTMPRRARWTAGLLLVWLGLVVVSWVRWNQITYAPLGRLFFQANAAIVALLGYGLARLTSRPRHVIIGVGAGLWVLALAGALFIVRPAFALPPRYPISQSPVPPQPLPQTTFGNRITALSYEVSPRSLEPGQTLEVTLFLQATCPLTDPACVEEDYALALQLLSPVPGDDTTLVNFNTLPGGGNYPYCVWQPGEVVVDRYRLQVPERVAQAQAWQVGAVFYRLSDGERLPVTVAGQPASGMLGLGLVRVGASEPPTVPLEARAGKKHPVESGPLFGDAIQLEGVLLRPEGQQVRVQVWWRAMAHLPGDHTTLVHLYDAGEEVLATADAPPLRGAFPTSLWEPGDLIADEFLLPLEESGKRVGLGWYDPSTGVRLPISGAASQTVTIQDIPLP
jgi:hypothetical protein